MFSVFVNMKKLTSLFGFFFVFVFIFSKVFSVSNDYYWRDYNGTIPTDAVVGGQNSGHPVYIGQAYIRNEGVFVVMINPGDKEVLVPIKGVKKSDKYIKILCGPKDNFEWVPTNGSSLHYTLLDRHAVIGGHEDSLGYIHIGKSDLNGNTQIGKINAFVIGDANLYIAGDKKERIVKDFEVLCFVDYGGSFDIRSQKTSVHSGSE